MRSGTVENLHDFKGKLDKIKELKIFKKIYAVTLDKCVQSDISCFLFTLRSWSVIITVKTAGRHLFEDSDNRKR